MKFKKKKTISVSKTVAVKPKAQTATLSTELFLFTAFKKTRIIASVVLLFAAALGFLIYAPQALQLTESKVIVASNEPWQEPRYLVAEASEVNKKPRIQIIDARIQPPKIGAHSVIALDYDSGQVLYQKNIHERVPPASTTKMMTALASEEKFQPADLLVVYPQALVGGSVMGLSAGEKLTFRSLLYGMLLNSGNDAAYTLALNYPGGFDAFVARMNEKAKEFGLLDTHFVNPVGFDNPAHYSSAYDLSQIAKIVAQDPQLSKIVATKETSVEGMGEIKPHILKNLNQLLSEDGVLGIKTGFTQEAGESLVGLVERKNHKVITVVLNSKDRFVETKNLMDWVYQNFTWQETPQ